MMTHTKLALVGPGVWGENYIKTIDKIDGINLEQIVCKNIKSKTNLSKKYYVTDILREVTESNEIDGIIIATPPCTHFQIAYEAIKSKKPVIIEKPLTLNSQDANSLLNLALTNKVNVRVNHIYLYHPVYRFLKKYIKNKKGLKFIFSQSGNYGPFREDVSPLWDWAPHDLSMCLDLIEEMPISIDAKFTKEIPDSNGNKSNINVLLGFKNQKFAELNFGNLMENKKRYLRVDFHKNSYIFDPLKYNFIQKVKLLRQKGSQLSNVNDYSDFKKSPLENLLNDFVSDIKNERFQMHDLNLAKNTVFIMELINSKLNKKIKNI